MRDPLYPPIEPYDSGVLPVDPLHQIYWEVSGNPKGKSVVFLHGGPGYGTVADHRRFFDPEAYRIVLFDQRGCGKSTPHASLERNTTWDLVADMEKLRIHLEIDRWQAFGGSWGSTLALAYAESHPDRVSELVLRGIFLLRPEELRWFYQEGCSAIYPDAFESYLAPIPEAERGDLLAAYHQRLTSDDSTVRLEAAKAWSVWEASTITLLGDPRLVEGMGKAHFAEAFARIENHYFVHGGFLRHPDQLLHDAHKIRAIPGVIIHGRYDVVCPLKSAWDLHKVWPEADLHIIQNAGHAASEPGIAAALVAATDGFRGR